jgi:hypothetical protein
MALCRYKTMLSYLPGMATVVNAFDSPVVQEAVFKDLMQALNLRMELRCHARAKCAVPPT